MKEPSVSPGPTPAPVFLTKLWVLVEDSANCDMIAWNTNGQTFCILDEQRFTKEILPRYFKHSNLSSFIRQLNMYGFRKVMSLESGLVKSESAIEFQHPFFKKGRPELLEHIKRKVNSVKTEDAHLSQDNLQKVINELKVLQDGQSNMDFKLDTMKRENEILWKEVSSLRRKHSQQQKLLAKILQFILSLMKGNILKGTNRKRPLTIEASQSSSPKYSRNMLQLTEGGVSEGNPSSQCPGSSTDNYLVIHEIPSAEESFEHLPKQLPKSSLESLHDTQQVILMDETDVNLQLEVEESHYPSSSILAQDQVVIPNAFFPVTDQSVIPSNSFVVEKSFIPNSSTADEELALDLVQDSAPEDPDSVIDSILNENASASNINILDREEIQDFLNCIDASLEDLQTILCKKKFDVDSDFLEELFKPDLLSSDITVTSENSGLNSGVTEGQKDIPMPSSEDLLNKGKQMVQYTGNPLLSLFDELPQSSYGEGASDPVNLLNVVDDNVFPGHSDEQHVMKEADLAVDDNTGSHGFSPIFVLSPVSKLIEEATEPDTV
ncbi:hypothetical protein XELAEV_18038486mg [Xenopus laevis]|uniref:HSF-type DNA-binding domain-containing protein n=1 Tax=Xenopus laevis TaxID=8355 RepID=A0A974H703_XENLA|nr:hypothetical protein XELAEV_18038486mg [Xenopus laevis]